MKAAVVLEEVQMLLFHFSAEFVCGGRSSVLLTTARLRITEKSRIRMRRHEFKPRLSKWHVCFPRKKPCMILYVSSLKML